MMCDKDILWLFFEDSNCAMPLLKISYHHTISVTVSSSKRYQVCAGCLLPRNIFLDILTLKRWDRLVIPKHWNGITTLGCALSPQAVQQYQHMIIQRE